MIRRKSKTFNVPKNNSNLKIPRDRTPSPDAFNFRPNAEEDNAPTEREIEIRTVAADQID
jgi:hypothetical protein